jgi:hypothetical protein
LRALLCLIALLSTPAFAADGLPLMRAMESGMQSDGEELAVTMQLVAPDGRTEARTFRMWQLSVPDKANKSLIRFETPSSIARTALLMVQRPGARPDNWLYVPALNQVRRIAPQDGTDSFVGSQFTIEDMTVSVNPEARTYTVLGDVPCGEGRTCTQVEDKPATDQAAKISGYGRVVLYIDTERHVAHRIDFYDKAGGLMKVMTAKGLVPVGERWRFDSATVTEVATGASTIMTVTGRKQGGVDDALFSPSTLDAG